MLFVPRRRRDSQAAVIPRWGGLIILDVEEGTGLAKETIEAAFDLALAQLRESVLGIDREQPSTDAALREEGIAFARKCARARAREFVSTLRSLSRQRGLAGADTYVRKEAAKAVGNATMRMARAAALASRAESHTIEVEYILENATYDMQTAHVELIRVAEDPAMTSPGFFPTEHYLSVVLPLALPAVITLATSFRKFALNRKAQLH